MAISLKVVKENLTYVDDKKATHGNVDFGALNGDSIVGYEYNHHIFKKNRHYMGTPMCVLVPADWGSTGGDVQKGTSHRQENNNGNVLVSDSGAIVVTERGGRHRFTYTGHPTGSGLDPRGICTDALSHILVCDCRTNTVQILDKDGQFLSHLLKESENVDPYSLCYDVNSHRLWVGSGSWDNNKVCVYRYIDIQQTMADANTFRPDRDTMSSTTPA
uniref:Uncharacterized protein n=1 Tax=Magallana gigas TaxID=29159 RepID=K1QTF0_MAGGI